MIATLKTVAPATPSARLHALIDEIGPIRVLLILTGAVVRRARQPGRVYANDLSNHLRKDIGLWPLEPPPPFRGPIF